MKRYYVEFITNTQEIEGLSSQISFYVYGWSADQVRDQLGDYEIIAIDQTDQGERNDITQHIQYTSQ